MGTGESGDGGGKGSGEPMGLEGQGTAANGDQWDQEKTSRGDRGGPGQRANGDKEPGNINIILQRTVGKSLSSPCPQCPSDNLGPFLPGQTDCCVMDRLQGLHKEGWCYFCIGFVF